MRRRRKIADLNPRTMPGPGDFDPPEDPPEVDPDEVLALVEDDRALAVNIWLCEEDGDSWGGLDDDWTDDDVSAVLRDYLSHFSWDDGALIIRRSVPVAVVGMSEGWAAPVVVRLPDHGEAADGAVRVTLTPADLRALGHVDGEQGIASTIRAVVGERDALRAALDDVARRLCGRGWGNERDGAAPHLHDHEIAGRVDDVLVALHRAEEERADALAEGDALRAEVERLRKAALRAIEVAFRSGNQYGHEATAEGQWCSEPDFDGAEDYLADALAEVSDG